MDTERRADSTAAGKTAGSKLDEKRIANKLAIVGVSGNVALSAFKLFAGIFGNSAAMVSDAVHSLSDVFATAVACSYAPVAIDWIEANPMPAPGAANIRPSAMDARHSKRSWP